MASCTCNAGTSGNVTSCTTTSLTIERSCGASGSDACSASHVSDYVTAGYTASVALDGDLNLFSHTSGTTFQDPTWWRLDFGRSMTVTKVTVYNRINTVAIMQRLDGFTITVGESPSVDVNAVCASNQIAPTVAPYRAEVTCPTPLPGRYVHISIYGPSRILSLAEVLVTGCGPVCPVCAAGAYKSTTGSDTCTNCGAGKYSNTDGATTCLTCEANSGDSCGACYTSACPWSASYIIAQYSTTAPARFISLIQSTRSFASVSTRNNVAVGSAILPTYNALGGPNGKGHVSFARASSQFLNAGSRTLNIATNGGLTVVAVVRFTGTVGTYERIIDLYSGTPSNNLIVARDGTAAEVRVILFNAATKIFDFSTTGGMLVQNSWLTIVFTYRASTMKYLLWVNTIPFFGTATAAATDRTVSVSNMGKSYNSPDAYLNADIAGVFVVDEVLNLDATTAIANSMLQGVDLTITTCPNSNYSCSECYTSACPCNAGYTGGNFISQYSTTACSRFIALMVWKRSFASVSTRLNAAVGTLPTYNPTGGPSGKGHVSFATASFQYLDAGSRTFNIATNGGFTMVAVVRFTGTAGAFERIIDLGSGAPNNNLIIARSSTTEVTSEVWNGVTKVGIITTTGGILVQNSWLTVVCTYRASTNVFVCSVNGISFTVNPSASVTDRTVTSTYVSKSLWGTNYLNGDIAGLFFVDEYLNTDATSAIVNTIVNGVDMTDTTCPAGNACTACATGTYKPTTGSVACTTCPASTTSPIASTSSTACISLACNAGYTGPDGGVCSPCVAGKYKIATGSAACTNCGTGTYSTTAGATAAATCLACPANSNSPAGSTAAASCACNAGFALSNNVCVCGLGYEPGA